MNNNTCVDDNTISNVTSKFLKKRMVENGCDPKDGWVLLIPYGYFGIIPLPDFVIESNYIEKPTTKNKTTDTFNKEYLLWSEEAE